MEQKKFEALLKIITPQVIHLIAENYKTDEISAATKFYNSKVYALLEDESTKVWHLSPLTIFNMYDGETKTGVVKFPEEV
ncbi:MAG: hypothetical protein E7544_02600 [Ruminococcaceae bacterium]|nr:hypothetical protein [Oscillospiraceae bacterium]